MELSQMNPWSNLHTDTPMTEADMDRAWADYKAEEHQRLNGGIACRLLARVAFSHWRRALVVSRLDRWAAWCRGRGWRRLAGRLAFWHDRVLDALYPDDCVVAFKAKGGAS